MSQSLREQEPKKFFKDLNNASFGLPMESKAHKIRKIMKGGAKHAGKTQIENLPNGRKVRLPRRDKEARAKRASTGKKSQSIISRDNKQGKKHIIVEKTIKGPFDNKRSNETEPFFNKETTKRDSFSQSTIPTFEEPLK